MLPDGLGGIVATWGRYQVPSPEEWRVTRFDGAGQRSDFDPGGAPSIMLMGDVGTAYLYTTTGTQAMDVTTWTPKWTAPIGGYTPMAIAGGDVVVRESWLGDLSIVDETGVVRATVPMPIAEAQQVLNLGEWVGISSSGILAATIAPALVQPSGGSLLGEPLILQDPMFSCVQGTGTPSRQSAPPAGFTEREPAALEGLRRAYPLSARDGSEYGGLVCRIRGRFHISRLHTDFIQDQVQVPAGFCPADTKAAHFHTHPPLENPLPSGPDYPNADANPGIPYYLMAPIPQSPVFPPRETRVLKYWNGAGRQAVTNLCLRISDGTWVPSTEIDGNEGAVCTTPIP